MSVLETLTGKKPPRPSAPEILRRRETAEAELIAADCELAQAALDAIEGDAAAKAKYQDAKKLVAELHEKVRTFSLAHDAALANDAALLEAQRASIRATQRRAQRKHLEAADKASTRLAAALPSVVADYSALVESLSKARAALPIGSEWPGGLSTYDVGRLVSGELFRLACPPVREGLPNLVAPEGALFPGTRWIQENAGDTSGMTPFVERVRADIAKIIDAVDATFKDKQ